MPSTRRALPAALALLLLLTAAPMAAGPAQAAPARTAAEPVTLTGTYELLARDLIRPDGTADHAYSDRLRVGERHYELRLPAGRKPAGGSRVRVSGSWASPRAFDATGIEVLGAPRRPDAQAATVLVILAYWSTKDTVTTQRAYDQILGDDARWFKEASYGQTAITGRVTPWVKIPAPPYGKCSVYDDLLMSNAKAKARALGSAYDPTTYSRTVLYFPRCTGTDTANVAGWAYEPGDVVWLNGYMDRRTSVHELGHTYGMSHARAYKCTSSSGTRVTMGGTCSRPTYGDPFDAMGQSSYVAHPHGINKMQAGWLDDTRKRVLSQATTSFVLPPYEKASTSPHVVVANSRASKTRQYWLEYRRPVGFDAKLPAGATGGVLVHLHDSTLGGGGFLLDPTPSDGSFSTAVVRTGTSWTAPDGLKVTVRSATSTGASVTVSGARVDPTPPSVPRYFTATGRDNAMLLRWSPPATDGGSPLVGYQVTVQGGWNEYQLFPGPDDTSLLVEWLRPGDTHTFLIRAKNDIGVGSGVAYTATVPTFLPSVSVTAPDAGATVRGQVQLTAAPTAHPQSTATVETVQFLVGGAHVGSVDEAPWTLPFSTAGLPNGANTVVAVVWDSMGRRESASTSITVDNYLPTVSLTAPADGTTTDGDTLVLEAAAAPSAPGTAPISTVRFYDVTNGWDRLVGIATSAPWTASWNVYHESGPRRIAAVATDTEGVSGRTAPVSVTIAHPKPTIEITSPAPDAVVRGTSVEITANAAAPAPGRAIDVVHFYAGYTHLGSDTTAPYTVTWDTSTIAGARSIRAVARERTSGREVSTTSYVTVDNVLPVVRVDRLAPMSPGVVKLTGTAVPGSAAGPPVDRVEVMAAGRFVGRAAVAADGTWAIDWDATYHRGAAQVVATATGTDGVYAKAYADLYVVPPVPSATMNAPTAGALVPRGTPVALAATVVPAETDKESVYSVCFVSSLYQSSLGCGVRGDDGVWRTSWTPNDWNRGRHTVYPVVTMGSWPGSRHSLTASGVEIVVVSPPPAPLAVRAEQENDNAISVTWDPAPYYEALPITGWVVTASPGDETRTVSGVERVLFEGLQHGVSYTFRVAAVNAAGTGPAAGDYATAGTPTWLSLSPLAAQTVTYGSRVTVNADLVRTTDYQAVAGHALELVVCPHFVEDPWAEPCFVGARTLTDAQGLAALSYVAKENASLAVRLPGGDPYLPNRTDLGPVHVNATATSALSSYTVAAGTTVRLYGHAGPATPGARVYLQRYYENSWHNGAYGTQSSTGYVSIPITKPRGTYKYRLWVPGGARTGHGYSTSRTLTVT